MSDHRRVEVQFPAARGAEPEKFTGKFHGWGTNYEEFETGAGNFTCAIVERDDGSVELVYANCVRFLDAAES